MPRENGVYQLPSGNPFVGGTVANSTVVNTTLDDLGEEITNSVPRDGTAAATADLPMGAFKHTGVANGSARNHYAAVGQVQDSTLLTLHTVGGTADAITANLTPPIVAYANGQRFTFKPTAPNTSATTLAINGLSALQIYKGTGSDPNITELVAGDLGTGYPADLICNGSALILQNPQTEAPGAVWATLIANNDPFKRSAAEIAAGITPTNFAYDRPGDVRRYGAIANRTTDCLAAFEAAAAVALYSGTMYIPAAPIKGHYYRLSSEWRLTDLDGITVEGDGDGSVILIDNDEGFNAITVDSSIHVTFKDFAIFGIEGSGNGIELDNGSHHFRGINLYSAFMDGAAFKVTWGISGTWINCRADRNIGYRPATLLPGMTEGRPARSFHVTSREDGQNNNHTFIGCQGNACGDIVTCQFGDAGGVPVQSIIWDGGLIQGSDVGFELFARVTDSDIRAHLEPPVGEITGNFCAVFDGCTDTIIHDCVVTGDIDITGTCRNLRLDGTKTCGINIESTCADIVVRDLTYANVTSGATGGKIIDGGVNTVLQRLKNASNDRFSIGHNLRSPVEYFRSNMQHWVGGGSPTVPCGFTSYGTATITRDTLRRTGSFSVQLINASDLAGGIQIELLPDNYFTGKRFTVEVWIFSDGAPGLGRISMVDGGAGTYTEVTHLQDVWEKVVVTFAPTDAPILRLTGKTGTIYIDAVAISVDDFTPIEERTLDGTATPTISYGGRHIPTFVTSGTPTITNFLEPHVGKPFTIRFAGATVISDNANIKLAGSGNFTGAAENTMTLMYGNDGVFHEMSRVVT